MKSLENIMEIENLRKAYGSQQAVKGISFYVGKGEFFALLGPNGSGKSTTVNIISTSLSKDSGKVVIDGLETGSSDKEIRKRIGIVFQNGVLDDLLTVEENLYTRGRFYGFFGRKLQGKIKEVASLTGISDFLNRQYGRLSGGQKRRCDIARALLHSPKILLLDEPTTGLDPQMRREIWKTIGDIRENTSMSVLLTTHYMEEAAGADRLAIMQNGEIIFQSTPVALKECFSKDRLIFFFQQPSRLKRILKEQRIVFSENEESIVIPLTCTTESLRILELCKGSYTGFEVLQGNMDDAYLCVIGKENENVSFCS